jgi:hypothetical protein
MNQRLLAGASKIDDRHETVLQRRIRNYSRRGRINPSRCTTIAVRARERARPIMIRYYLTPIKLSFWSSPHESMSAIANWGAYRSERNSLSIKVVEPEILRNASPEKPAPRPRPDFPTDVPVPEPHDVPVPEPMDPPAPNPGKTPPPEKQEPEKKPRPVP